MVHIQKKHSNHLNIMKTKIAIISIIITFFAFGCIHKKHESLSLTDLDFNDAHLVEFETIFNVENTKIIPLETTEESLISNNYFMNLYDKDLFIFDYLRGQVLRFNTDGDFLNSIGKKGKGPAELLNPTDFYIDSLNKTIEILCEPGSTIKKFTFQGDFISKISFKFPSHSFIKDSLGFYYFYRGVNSGYSNARLTYANTTTVINEFLLDPGNAPVGLVLDQKCFVKNEGTVILKELLLNQILYLSKGQLIDGIRINFDENDVPIDYYRDFSNMMDFFQHLNDKGFYTIKNYDIHGSHAFIKLQYQKAEEELKSLFLSINLLTNSMQYVSGKLYRDLFNSMEFHSLLPEEKFLFSINSHNFQLLKPFIPMSAFESVNLREDDNPILIVFEH